MANQAAIYARTATNNAHACMHQLLTNRERIAQSRGKTTLSEIYIDNGTLRSKQPSWDTLMRDALAKKFNVLYVTRPDRITRDVVELEYILDILKKHSIKVVFTEVKLSPLRFYSIVSAAE